MGLGIVTDEEYERESAIIVEHNPPGRGHVKEIPEGMRKVIAESAILNGNQATIEAFGVSQASVSAYRNGANSTASYNQPDAGLAKHVDAVKDNIVKVSKSKLLAALSHITNEKLNEAKPRDLAGIAKDMSMVISNMEPQGVNNQNNFNAQFIYHSYPAKKENEYEVIDIVDPR